MLLQINEPIATAMDSMVVAEQTVEESINLWTMAQYGGWIMIILAFLLAWAV